MYSPDEAYQRGLLDVVNEIPTLEYVLRAAEEFELMNSYICGRVVGESLIEADATPEK